MQTLHQAMHDRTREERARHVGVARKTINTVENGRYAPAVFLALTGSRGRSTSPSKRCSDCVRSPGRVTLRHPRFDWPTPPTGVIIPP